MWAANKAKNIPVYAAIVSSKRDVGIASKVTYLRPPQELAKPTNTDPAICKKISPVKIEPCSNSFENAMFHGASTGNQPECACDGFSTR